MIIRQAQMADLDAIYAIELENFSPEEAISREILAKHIETIPSTFLVAEKNGKILGYLEGPVRPERHLHDVSFTLEIEDYHTSDGGFISLTSLSISKEAQGLGVGKALFEKALRIAESGEFDWAWLGVWEKNYKAQHFYKHYGFEKFGEHQFIVTPKKADIDWLLKKSLG